MFVDGRTDLVLSEERGGRVAFVLLVDVSHDFPGASIGSVNCNRSKPGNEFLSDRVGFVVKPETSVLSPNFSVLRPPKPVICNAGFKVSILHDSQTILYELLCSGLVIHYQQTNNKSGSR